MKACTVSAVILVLLKLTAAQDLFTGLDDSTEGIAECEMEGIDSCTKIDFNFDLLKGEGDFAVNGETFMHSYTHGKTYGYQTDNYGSAVFVYSEANGHPEVEGDLIFEGNIWRIDGCGEECQILVKLGWDTIQSMPDEEHMAAPAPVIRPRQFDQGTPSDRAEMMVGEAKPSISDGPIINKFFFLSDNHALH